MFEFMNVVQFVPYQNTKKLGLRGLKVDPHISVFFQRLEITFNCFENEFKKET